MKKQSIKQLMMSVFIYTVLSAAAAMLFYDNILASAAALPFFILFNRAVKSAGVRRYRQELTDQFIKALISISTSLSAGLSPENAFIAAKDDMEKLYGRKSPIAQDMAVVCSKVQMGQRIDRALFDLAKREKIRDIYDFAVVFTVASEKGGDFPSVISSAVSIMETRREAENEAKVMIRARQYEQRLMCIIPPGILLYLRLSSGSFMDVLYHNALGASIMTFCLVVYVLAILWSEKIGDIQV